MAGTKIETINGRTYTFGTLPATEAVAVLVTIGTIIGEPLFKAIAGGKPTETKKSCSTSWKVQSSA